MPKKDRRTKGPGKPGRPSGFNLRIAQRILALAQEGKTDKEIAEEVGIALSTLKNWKGHHPDFSAAINASKRVADDLVEQALFRRAMGYSHPAVKIHFDGGEHGTGEFKVKEYIEVYPPDTAAAQFWLKNRRPKKWREKTEVDVQSTSLEALIMASKKPEEKK